MISWRSLCVTRREEKLKFGLRRVLAAHIAESIQASFPPSYLLPSSHPLLLRNIVTHLDATGVHQDLFTCNGLLWKRCDVDRRFLKQAFHVMITPLLLSMSLLMLEQGGLGGNSNPKEEETKTIK